MASTNNQIGLENRITEQYKKEFKEVKQLAKHLDYDHRGKYISAFEQGLIDIEEARLAQNMFDYLETQREMVGVIKDDYIGFTTDAIKIGAVTYALFANGTLPDISYAASQPLTPETLSFLGLLGVSTAVTAFRFFGPYIRHNKQRNNSEYLIDYIENHDSLYSRIMNLSQPEYSDAQDKRDSLLREIYQEDISGRRAARILYRYETEDWMDYELAMSKLEDYRPLDSLRSKKEKLTQDFVTGAGNISEMILAGSTMMYGVDGDLISASLVQNLNNHGIFFF